MCHSLTVTCNILTLHKMMECAEQHYGIKVCQECGDSQSEMQGTTKQFLKFLLDVRVSGTTTK